MPDTAKLLRQVFAGSSGANVRFSDLRALLQGLGFDERIRGSHYIYTRVGLREIVNLQPDPHGSAKS